MGLRARASLPVPLRTENNSRTSAGSRAQAALADHGGALFGATFVGIPPHLLLYRGVKCSISDLRAPRSAAGHRDSSFSTQVFKTTEISNELLEAVAGNIPLQPEVPAQAIPQVSPQAAELQTHIRFLSSV